MPVFLKDIRADMRSFPRNVKEYPKLNIRKGTLEAIPSIGIESITYKAIVEGEEDDHIVFIQFFGVSFKEERDDEHVHKVVYNGKDYWYKTPSIAENKVFLKCSCSDFRFRWEKPLYDQSGLIGKWRPYKRKTDPVGWSRPKRKPKGRPYVNPLEIPGFCKHIWNLLLILNKLGRVKE